MSVDQYAGRLRLHRNRTGQLHYRSDMQRERLHNAYRLRRPRRLDFMRQRRRLLVAFDVLYKFRESESVHQFQQQLDRLHCSFVAVSVVGSGLHPDRWFMRRRRQQLRNRPILQRIHLRSVRQFGRATVNVHGTQYEVHLELRRQHLQPELIGA